MSLKFWQSRSRGRHVKQLPGIINIPAFDIQSGIKRSCHIDGSILDSVSGLQCADSADVTQAFTFQAWVKIDDLIEPASPGYVLFANGDLSAPPVGVRISIFNRKLQVTFVTDDTYTIVSNYQFIPGEWVNIAVTFNNVGTSSGVFNIYVNGVLDSTHDDASLIGEGDINDFSANFFQISQAGLAIDESFHISSLYFWSVPLIQDVIKLYMFDVPSPLNNGLMVCVTFKNVHFFAPGQPDYYYNEVTGSHVIGLDGGIFLITDDFPHCNYYGCSFIVGEFTINTADEQKFSLKAPITIPDNCTNFVACVSYLEEDCNCSIPAMVRYQLWDYTPEACLNTFDKCEDKLVPGVLEYCGQVLPSGCKIEIWSIDGQTQATLEQIKELETSILHAVTLGTETAKTEDATLELNTALCAEYPLVYPINFDNEPSY